MEPVFDDIVRELATEIHEIEDYGFPVEAFPPVVQKIIRETREKLKYPVDFTGGAILLATSVAIGNTVKVRVNSEWKEGSLLYIVLVGKPGTAKSHPLTFMMDPILQRDHLEKIAYDQARREWEESEEKRNKPILRKKVVSDYTPEALVKIHEFNRRGICVYADELAGWVKNFNRYHKGSEQEFWLSNWSGKPIIIDRKTDQESVHIPTPFISVGGTMQPGILDEMAKDSRTSNGFVDRILFCYPDGLKKDYWNSEQMDPGVREAWTRILDKMLSLEMEEDDKGRLQPVMIGFSVEAWKILDDWQRRNTDSINDAPDEVAGIYSKLEIYAIRLSLILQLLRWASGATTRNDGVSVEAVEGAIRLIEYFRRSALKVHSAISNIIDRLPDDKREFYFELPDKFKTSEALEIAKEFNIPERNCKRFLSNNNFFRHPIRGINEKQI